MCNYFQERPLINGKIHRNLKGTDGSKAGKEKYKKTFTASGTSCSNPYVAQRRLVQLEQKEKKHRRGKRKKTTLKVHDVYPDLYIV